MNRRTRSVKKQRSVGAKKIVIVVVLCILFFGYSNYNSFKGVTVKESKKVVIDSKDRFSTLGNKIPELDSIWYALYLKNNAPDFELQAGTYALDEGENITEIFESLQKPITNSENVTILEGWNAYDIDEKLTKLGLINKGDYTAYITNPVKIEALREYFPFLRDVELETLEGYLYPETYKINPDEFGVNILVIAQLEAFETKVYDKILKDKLNSKEIYELVNLASIVEKEEKIKSNKKMVAGILKKRLDNNWQIGADATVCYPFKLTSEECKMVVTKYIGEKNDYNTRTKTGLPKTPISNPNYETIEATLNYAKTDYWFYLHDITTGQIYYAKTNAEHERNKRNYIK